MDSTRHDVTRLLERLNRGDRSALDRLVPLVYDEIRSIAARFLKNERRDHTLQPTALAHEAYMRIAQRRDPQWEDRAHFLGVAAQAIRRILVEHARARGREKRGGDRVRVTLSDGVAAARDVDFDLLALEEALERLGAESPADRDIVVMRFFGGLTVEETATALDLSERTVHRRWRFARAWLYRELNPAGGDGGRSG